MGGTIPVSYTHLDVYKRQPEYITKIDEGYIIDSEVFQWTNQPTLCLLYTSNRSPGEYFQGDALAEARKEEGAMPDLSGFAKLYFQICLLYTSAPGGAPSR